MKNVELQFSVEELVVILVQAGKPAEAKELLASAFGKMSPEEEKGRLRAASHSLLARDFLVLSGNELHIQSEPALVAKFLSDSTDILRFSRTGIHGEDVHAFYRYSANWMLHKVSNGLAHRFMFPASTENVVESTINFFAPFCEDITEIVLVIPEALLTGSVKSSETEKIITEIRALGGSAMKSRSFVDDFANKKWRGSMLRTKRINPDETLVQGVLWMQGSQHLWQITSQETREKQPVFQAKTASLQEFRSYIRTLVDAVATG